jgi:hypothetical protein
VPETTEYTDKLMVLPWWSQAGSVSDDGDLKWLRSATHFRSTGIEMGKLASKSSKVLQDLEGTAGMDGVADDQDGYERSSTFRDSPRRTSTVESEASSSMSTTIVRSSLAAPLGIVAPEPLTLKEISSRPFMASMAESLD